MIAPDEFDAFYKDARDRLLLQTYALTGDLPASRSAVRDSFIVAWHHWRKVSRMSDPESWARPHAWQHAQRRHTARLWHRDKSLDADARATLDSLGKLPVIQRKALLLTHLAAVSMGDLAREIGLPRTEAERTLQTATAKFAVHRDVPTTHIRPLFEPLRAHVEGARWPRPTIIRRAGAARRRTHTMVGAGVAVAALLVSGSLVTDASGVRPTLDGDRKLAAEATRVPAPPVGEPGEESPPGFTGDALLTSEQVAARVPGRRWTNGSTSDNTEGDGLVTPCQTSRFADPKGRATLVRTFDSKVGRPVPRVVQVAELSSTDRAADRAFDTTAGWYSGCVEPRVQLITTKRVKGVADEAVLMVLRSWSAPGATYVAGVARTGRITTTTVTRTPVRGAPALPSAARLLAAAVQGLCDQEDAGSCVSGPRVLSSPPVAAGSVPGMLAEVDLPPVATITKPWVGTEARKATTNVADTRCDQTEFNQRGITQALTRSFLIPGTRLPAAFGLTETVGTMPVKRARAFVSRVRSRMSTCPDKDLGTDVSRLMNLVTPARDVSVWRVTTEVSDDRSVTFLMGVVRDRTAVAQVGFVPHRNVTMGTNAFVALVERAAERLTRMPPPG